MSRTCYKHNQKLSIDNNRDNYLKTLVTIVSIFLTLWKRLECGFGTFPHDLDSTNLAIAIALYILLALLVGWQSGFLRWQPQSRKLIFKVMATSLVAPAILEEAFFRVILLPYPANNISLWEFIAWSAFSLVLFVLYHPLNASTAFPQGKPLFFTPIFLCLATALGIVCTFAYWQTGSIWLSVVIHWLVVVLWLLCFGGWRKLALH